MITQKGIRYVVCGRSGGVGQCIRSFEGSNRVRSKWCDSSMAGMHDVASLV